MQPREGTGAWRPSRRYLALALAIAVGVPACWLMWAPATSPAEPRSADGAAAAVSSELRRTVAEASAKTPEAAAAATPAKAVAVADTRTLPVPPPAIPRLRDPDADQTPDLADYVNPGERPTMAEVINRLHDAGVYTGLGAFSPPGTRPPLVGLAVPEGFELPPGYVRHHQVTDDGQRIEAILMFSADYQWYDGTGKLIALPADRVVPPELAPPGLPLRRIVVPAPAEPGKHKP